MANAETPGEIDPNELDLTSVMEWMQRNNLTSVKLHIEAVEEPEPEPPARAVLVAERRDLIDNTMPSDLGLEGVFLVAFL